MILLAFVTHSMAVFHDRIQYGPPPTVTYGTLTYIDSFLSDHELL